MYGRCLILSTLLHGITVACMLTQVPRTSPPEFTVGVSIAWIEDLALNAAPELPPAAPPEAPAERSEPAMVVTPPQVAVAQTPAVAETVEPPVQAASAPPAASSYSPARLRAGECEPPVYPESARRAGLEGLVVLTVDIATNGSVTSVDVRNSSGHAALDYAARRAVALWRFSAGVANGTVTASRIEVPIRFRLQ